MRRQQYLKGELNLKETQNEKCKGSIKFNKHADIEKDRNSFYWKENYHL